MTGKNLPIFVGVVSTQNLITELSNSNKENIVNALAGAPYAPMLCWAFWAELILSKTKSLTSFILDTKVLKTPMITANFKQFKNGDYKTIAIFSKKARGMMARFIIDNNIDTIEGLKSFSSDGYLYSDKLSTSSNLIFTR